MESTKLLRVTQGFENTDVFWTCFDLINTEAKQVFCTFCVNLIESVLQAPDETAALSKLKKRFLIWKTLFKNDTSAIFPRELVQGLYGELYFIKHYLTEKYPIQSCIMAWSGPNEASKDFSIGTEWYEVKTIGANTDSIHISSLTQLSSEYPGKLAVIRTEKMSQEFSNGESSLLDLINSIMSMVNDEGIEDIFMSKVASYNVDLSDAAFNTKFDVKSCGLYTVGDGFPRITIDDIPYSEISNVSYVISFGGIKRFLED